MKRCVIVGVGQLGGVFAHGLLRTGYTVSPIRRGERADQIAQEVDPAFDPEFVLVAVGEADLPEVLESLPPQWRSRVALVQNELLPSGWAALNAEPTVASVWFEKKKPIAAHPILSTPIAGPHAEPLVAALTSLDLEAHVIRPDALVPALVLKNLYILSANVTGLAVTPGASTGDLWKHHRQLTLDIALDALRLQRALLRSSGHEADADRLNETVLIEELGAALLADPDHGACGRSAPARRERALAQAVTLGVLIPHIENARPARANT